METAGPSYQRKKHKPPAEFEIIIEPFKWEVQYGSGLGLLFGHWVRPALLARSRYGLNNDLEKVYNSL